MRSGILLAGGISSRFGREKSLIMLKDKPLVKWVIERLEPVVEEIIVSVNAEPSAELISTVGDTCTLISDEEDGIGPIGGLLPSLRAAAGEYAAVTTCDSPFIVPELYEMLFMEARGRDGAVPSIKGRYEPLHAVYHCRTFADALENVLAEDKRKPIEAYKYMNIKFIDRDNLMDIDPDLETFFNINRDEDLVKAEKMI